MYARNGEGAGASQQSEESLAPTTVLTSHISRFALTLKYIPTNSKQC